MRKLFQALTTACLTVALVAPAAAQNVSLGVKGGLNFVELIGKDATQMDAKAYLRGIGGGFAVFEITPTFSLQPEVLYSQKGTKITWDQVEAIKGNVKLDYLEVPLLLRFTVPHNDNTFVPNAFIGPTVAYRVDCKATVEESGVKATIGCDDPDSEMNVRNWDYSAVFGLGADVKVGKAAIVLDGRYTRGLRKVDGSGVDDDVRNSAFSAMVGVKLNLAPSRLAIIR